MKALRGLYCYGMAIGCACMAVYEVKTGSYYWAAVFGTMWVFNIAQAAGLAVSA